MKPNYDILFKSAVFKLQMDAIAYNELLRKTYTVTQIHFDDEGHPLEWRGQTEMARETHAELVRQGGIVKHDMEEVERLRKLKEAENETSA